MILTGTSDHTVCDWMNLCSYVPVRMFENRTKFGGPRIVIQVDECLLRGLRKNNKGRFQLADLSAENLNDDNDSDSENVNPLKNGARNYGRLLDEPGYSVCVTIMKEGVLLSKKKRQNYFARNYTKRGYCWVYNTFRWLVREY